MPYILPYTAFYGPVRLIQPSVALYDFMPYLIPFYDLPLLASPYVCLILTPWMSDSQQVGCLCIYQDFLNRGKWRQAPNDPFKFIFLSKIDRLRDKSDITNIY